MRASCASPLAYIAFGASHRTRISKAGRNSRLTREREEWDGNGVDGRDGVVAKGEDEGWRGEQGVWVGRADDGACESKEIGEL